MKRFAIALMGAVSMLSPSVMAGQILSPTAVINNTIGEYGFGGDQTQMINQSGLSSGFVSGADDFDTYIAGNPTHARDDFSGWIGPAGGPFTGILDFDLGAVYSISELALWNSPAGSDANVQGFTLFGSNDSTFATSTNLGSFVNPQLDAYNPYPVTVFSFDPLSVEFVRLQIESYYGNGNVVEIGEVAFDVNAAVETPTDTPEPASLALVGAGLAGMGVLRRRKKV